MIKDNISLLKSNISLICQNLGRNADEVTLVGVTKFASSENIKEALDCGISHIGENKIQEAQKKFPPLRQSGLNFIAHMIGHLQTNKVKHAVEQFDLIQSVDSLKLAAEIDKQAQKAQKTVEILVQVNCSGEEQKFGVSKREAKTLINNILQLENVHIFGLMTIAPMTDDEAAVRQCFKDLKYLFDELNEMYKGDERIVMRYLSMGMTNDYKIALEEGANMIRIGSAIFKHE